jgi:hypothetical protein
MGLTTLKILPRVNVLIFLLCLIALPLAYAGTYGVGNYGSGQYSIVVATDVESGNTGGSGGGGGSVGKSVVEPIKAVGCTEDLDCKPSEYCLAGTCEFAECFEDFSCQVDEVCHQYMCVKLFDVEIKEFESPIQLGDFFDFTYLIKGMANFNDDVIITFKIQSGETIVTSGQDVIYLGSFEEKTKKTKLFLPSTVASGVYTFFVEVSYGKYKAQSFRTIEIVVGEGVANITLLPQEESLIGSASEWSKGKVQPFLYQNLYTILFSFGIIVLSIMVLLAIRFLRRRPKRKKKKGKRKKAKRSYRQKVLRKLRLIKK